MNTRWTAHDRTQTERAALTHIGKQSGPTRGPSGSHSGPAGLANTSEMQTIVPFTVWGRLSQKPASTQQAGTPQPTVGQSDRSGPPWHLLTQ